MGIAAKTIAFRFDEQDRRRLQEIQDAFAPFLRTSSHVVRFCLELVHSLIFGQGTLLQVSEALQRLLGNTLQHEPPNKSLPAYGVHPALAGTTVPDGRGGSESAPATKVDPSFLYMQVMYARMAELDKERFARGRELR